MVSDFYTKSLQQGKHFRKLRDMIVGNNNQMQSPENEEHVGESENNHNAQNADQDTDQDTKSTDPAILMNAFSGNALS